MTSVQSTLAWAKRIILLMRRELRPVLVTIALTVWMVLGGACEGSPSQGQSGRAGSGGTRSTQNGFGGSGGAYRCGGPVTESQVVDEFCADAPPGTTEMAIVDADCGATIWSSGEYLDPVFTRVDGSTAFPDGGPSDGGLPPIGSISVKSGLGDLLQLANPGGIPAGSQPLVSSGDGTSLVVGVNFGFGQGGAMQLCYAQAGDVDVTLPTTATGRGAQVSFTANCRQNTPDAGTSLNLVGCFHL